jgi:hypothetical protein
MQTAPRHLTSPELEAGLVDVLASPRDEGTLEAIVVRPAPGDRRTINSAVLTKDGGIEGDRWVRDSYYRLEDGRSDPRNQVSLINARILRQIAGDKDSICLAGDNLVVDFDLSETFLPTGSRLAIGEVVVEFSDLPHTGCAKFEARYGGDARTFINNPRSKELRLRGRFARIITQGTIAVGDAVRKLGS